MIFLQCVKFCYCNFPEYEILPLPSMEPAASASPLPPNWYANNWFEIEVLLPAGMMSEVRHEEIAVVVFVKLLDSFHQRKIPKHWLVM